jgi:hypothetical protein
MPIPSTTGVLRANVKEMKTGDYIVCKYVASSGAVGTFSELGISTATEIPVAGSATPNGSFYLVKVDKGLLISDRNVQHSISWDILNAGRFIQGLIWDWSNIATMTSNTTPNGIASASSINISQNDAWKAFDKLNTTYWGANTVTQGWLQYDYGVKKKIIGYGITPEVNATTAPTSWTFEGWDGMTWIVLDKQPLFTKWASGVKERFSITTFDSYSKYRLNITATASNTIRVAEFEIYEQPPNIVRSLTGGVAHADANGNSATTAQGFGGFPINNEWDKFIIKFPVSKIQSGKTLNDVFNNSMYSWVQETPLIASKASTNRTMRASNVHPGMLSSTVDSSVGFRPVFEYRE